MRFRGPCRYIQFEISFEVSRQIYFPELGCQPNAQLQPGGTHMHTQKYICKIEL